MTALLVWATALFGVAGCLAIIAGICFTLYLKEKKQPYRGKANLYRGWTIALSIAITILAFPIVICPFLAVTKAKTTGVTMETQLDAQYVNNQNILSTYVTSYEEQLGVANLQSSKIQGIITAAVAGQGSLKDLIDPGKSPLYSALVEAYPKVSLAQYQQLISYIQQGRSAFQAGQTTLLELLSKFDAWRHSGFVFQPWLVSVSGTPGSDLHASVNGKTLTGVAAENAMWQIVQNPTAVAAFDTHTATALSATGH